jgi:hypothetical protein
MRDPRRLPGRDRKARRDRCDHDGRGKEFLPPQHNRHRAKRDRHDSGHRQNRLMIGGEVKRDAGAKRHRHPGQQPAGAGLRLHPLAQGFDQRRPDAETGRQIPASRRCGARRPSPGIAPFPPRNVALLRHATTPYDLTQVARLPDGALGRLAERMQKLEETRRGTTNQAARSPLCFAQITNVRDAHPEMGQVHARYRGRFGQPALKRFRQNAALLAELSARDGHWFLC